MAIVQKKREPAWDWVKGTAILAVIAIHSFKTDDLQGWEIDFALVGRQLVNFAVAVFFAVSGYLQGISTSFRLADRLRRVLIPYVIWTFIHVALFMPGHFLRPRALAIDFILGEGIGIGYFVIVLCQFLVLTPWLLSIKSARMHIGIMAIGTILGSVITYAMADHWKFPYSAIFFINWYPCFHLGLFVARFPQFAPGERGRVPLTIVAATLCLAVMAEAYYLRDYNLRLALSQTKLSSLAMAMALFLLALSLRGKGVFAPGFISWLGTNSFFIYLFHLLPFKLARRIVAASGFDNAAFHWLFCFAFAAVASIISIAVLRRIVPQRFQPSLLG